MENIRFSADWTKDGESLKSESKGLPYNAKPGIIHLALPVDMTNDDEQVGEFRDSENYFGLWDEMQWRSWSSKKELLTVPKDNFQRQTLVWAGWSNGPPYLGQVHIREEAVLTIKQKCWSWGAGEKDMSSHSY